MNTPSSPSAEIRMFPVTVFFLTILLLFVTPRLPLAHGPSNSIPNTDSFIRVMHYTLITGPDGKTVPFDEAFKNGWVSVSTTRLDKDNSPYRPKGALAYALSNKTNKPIQLQMGSDPTALTVRPKPLKTVDIPPGQTQQVTTVPEGGSGNFKTIMAVVVSVSLLLAALFVILTKRYQSSDRHWAYGTVGMIAGYWFRP